MNRPTRLTNSLAAGVAALALAGGVAPAKASATTTTSSMSADGTQEIVSSTSTATSNSTSSSSSSSSSSSTKTTTTTKVTSSTTTTKKAVDPATTCTLGDSSTGTSCEEAIAFMTKQMDSGGTAWHNLCLGLVSRAYGNVYSGIASASSAAYQIKADALMHTTTDLDSIPRGAVIWLTNSTGAGHVAISLGNGKSISSDVANGSIGQESGAVGIVDISFFTDTWGQTLIGWSAPTT